MNKYFRALILMNKYNLYVRYLPKKAVAAFKRHAPSLGASGQIQRLLQNLVTALRFIIRAGIVSDQEDVRIVG